MNFREHVEETERLDRGTEKYGDKPRFRAKPVKILVTDKYKLEMIPLNRTARGMLTTGLINRFIS